MTQVSSVYAIGTELKSSLNVQPVRADINQVNQFNNLLTSSTEKGVAQQSIQSVLNKVDEGFVDKNFEVVKAIKKFEETGSAVSLMAASHAGANKSVMVQLFGAVGKKCADNTEQIYKQQ